MITAMARKQRLDLVLVERGLALSRQQAQQLIRAGRVRSGDRLLDKPGQEVLPDLVLEVRQPQRYVSRGGEKLEAALDAFPIVIAGRACVDGGISTGGFTDCLLQRGAERVYGIDVGYGQTAWSLRSDPRVCLRERTNLRHLTAEQLYGPDDRVADLAVADVSFISLGLVLPPLLDDDPKYIHRSFCRRPPRKQWLIEASTYLALGREVVDFVRTPLKQRFRNTKGILYGHDIRHIPLYHGKVFVIQCFVRNPHIVHGTGTASNAHHSVP